MCGIAGVVAWDEQHRVTREQLRCMSDALAHRGPDGEGQFLNFDGRPITRDDPQCGFAFRRLAIIDPDPRSNQPFTIGPLTLVFNGEIYNFRDLKSEISNLNPDYQWRTQGDAEVLLMSYATWRGRCVDRLNGMYAFAVWDDAEKCLFLARDRMGQKPLYVARRDGAVAFASELAALRGSGWAAADVADVELAHYLAYGYARRSIYEGVSQLRPGERARIDRSGCEREFYFDPNEPEPKGEHPVAATRGLVEQAVTRQLVSDVPLGVLLSGGIDSSVVTACARRAGPVRTFQHPLRRPAL